MKRGRRRLAKLGWGCAGAAALPLSALSPVGAVDPIAAAPRAQTATSAASDAADSPQNPTPGAPDETDDPPVKFAVGLPDESADPTFVYEVRQSAAELAQRYASGSFLRAAYLRPELAQGDATYTHNGKGGAAYAPGTIFSDPGTYAFTLSGYLRADGTPWVVNVRLYGVAGELAANPVVAFDGGIPEYAQPPAAGQGGAAGEETTLATRENPDGSVTVFAPAEYASADYSLTKPESPQQASRDTPVAAAGPAGEPAAPQAGGAPAQPGAESAAAADPEPIALPPEASQWTFVAPGDYAVSVYAPDTVTPRTCGFTVAQPAGAAAPFAEPYAGSPASVVLKGVAAGGETWSQVSVAAWPAGTLYWSASLDGQPVLDYGWGKAFMYAGKYALGMTLADGQTGPGAGFTILGRGPAADEQTRQKNTTGMRDALIAGGVLAGLGIVGAVVYAKARKRRRRKARG